jgi:hypothetical protein
MAQKLLFVCSDVSSFDMDTKYHLKDRFRVYSSDECTELSEKEKREKLAPCSLVIIDVIKHKDDLKLLNLSEYKKVAVLRNHESRSVNWCSNAVLKADAVCKYHDHHLLKTFINADELIRNLNACNINVDADWKYYGKKALNLLLFCLRQ